jgi:hypothetical protein
MNLSLVYDQEREAVGTADKDNGIAAAPLAGQREAAACKRIVDAIGERTATDDSEFRGGRERSAHERTEREDHRRIGRQRIDRGPSVVEEESCSETAATDVLAQQRLGQRNLSARPSETSMRR